MSHGRPRFRGLAVRVLDDLVGSGSGGMFAVQARVRPARSRDRTRLCRRAVIRGVR